MAEKTINDALEQLETIVTELNNIEVLEKALKEKENDLLSKMDDFKQIQDKLDSEIAKVDSLSKKLDSFNSSFDPIISRIESLSNSFGRQLDDAKQIETKMLLSKMETLIEKAEGISAKNINNQPVKKENQSKPNQQSNNSKNK